MNSEMDIESEKSPEQIEREIDAQRASIGNIVDKLESKFTPGQMIDQAWGMMQNNGSMFLSNFGTSVRNNPVPAVLTSVGLLWLMMSQNRPPVPQPTYRTGPDQDRTGEWADGLAEGIGNAKDHLHQTADSLKEGYHSLKGKAGHLSDNVGEATDNLSHAMHDVTDRLTRNTQVLGQQFNQLLREQPLVVAAAGIALGAIIGAALPTTTTEQRYMGRTSAGLVDKVKKQAQEGYEAVRDTVTKTTGHVDARGPSSTPNTATNTSADLSSGLGTS
ncbi:DUF3618 domain-containing protein [Pseudomonas lurida]|uniref:DUF3618 domain-containing protein n=1 Tax=Pseudomonas TaxID=286 RepID=UPI0015E33AB6|nr:MULTISPECIES: DUF3618 domain-containing protein [Pseudomonas]MBA1292988.1 DUF3618 domain-containing protein [Pseudomonas lurida]MCP1513737.1 uncharacterized protein YjbJ (UPF0337 family) [Pseudomonas rhodesiae]MDF9772613.1 uncharacterized protein YjbJ (UPF0337 family) [Pseudomonas rhodesiae]